jgi:hypothetical protein
MRRNGVRSGDSGRMRQSRSRGSGSTTGNGSRNAAVSGVRRATSDTLDRGRERVRTWWSRLVLSSHRGGKRPARREERRAGRQGTLSRIGVEPAPNIASASHPSDASPGAAPRRSQKALAVPPAMLCSREQPLEAAEGVVSRAADFCRASSRRHPPRIRSRCPDSALTGRTRSTSPGTGPRHACVLPQTDDSIQAARDPGGARKSGRCRAGPVQAATLSRAVMAYGV